MSAAAANDSTDLEALFDSIVAANTAAPEPHPIAAAAPVAATQADPVINQIGQMTRRLHDTLRQLGYDKLVERAASAIPDTRERLAYVADMTEKAALRALAATETAKPLQERLETGAAELAARWHTLFDGKLGLDGFRELALATSVYLDQVPQATRATNAQLTEIMMAQDFQDLTGQVIKKITDVVHDVECELVKLLVQHAPCDRRDAEADALTNGPVINAAGRTDVVTNQAQVDELLESMGF